jgi:hypothetical protein
MKNARVPQCSSVQHYQGEQKDLYRQALLSGFGGNSTQPEDLEDSLFDVAKQKANSLKILDRAETLDTLRKLKAEDALDESKAARGAKYAGVEAKNKKLGEMEAFDLLAGEGEPLVEGEKKSTTRYTNPDDPRYKAAKDTEDLTMNLRKEFQGQQAFKDFQIAEKGFRAMTKAISDPQSTSDLDLVYGAIQMIEPGMAVREGEQAAVKQSGSIPQQWKGEIENALNGSARLGKEVREGILRLAERRYDEHAKTFNTQFDFYGKEAERLGLKGGISSMPIARSAEDVRRELLGSGGNSITSGNIVTAPDGRRILIK